ncbi:hypothetical protein [Sphingobacterium griseoflavum]|uniref:Asparagine synthetase domain-containing protein n=1 Tax=Sphingobacterium griseoflavum TaxID=1474952 RepID=A0ABQ3I0M5_9SPHI|nr:hypothetical protein [Sphingobacterium griseoflavum]GHE46476.1 hypothetical protein GCM10017764_32110 [Sphingobacterium griseoflavum]
MEVAKGNWIGYDTVFYNLKNKKYSKEIDEVIDYANLEIDVEGLSAYLDYGYCVFGRTPVKNVHYLLPHEVIRCVDGQLFVQKGEDSALQRIGVKSREDDVLGMISTAVNQWADSFSGDILIPTSGGFDSRLMNLVIHDKKRIRSYTYGTSFNQQMSREAVYAQTLSTRLGTSWNRVDLGGFNRYMNEWYTLFGPSVGASGTYHMEFYERIAAQERPKKLQLLSGIIGDAWAGAVHVPPITDPYSYLKLGYTHGMSADAALATGIDYRSLVEPIFDAQKYELQQPQYRIITAMRTKMMLLQYLIKVPEAYGFPGYSPFLDEDIALAMLNLPAERKSNRQWQRDFFSANNVLFEEEKHHYTYQNSLNYYALLHHPLEPLDSGILREIIQPAYLAWINSRIVNIGPKEKIFQRLMHTPKIKEGLKMLGFKNGLLRAYFAYITLKPIEIMLKKRNAS